jgi:hypothetical protein
MGHTEWHDPHTQAIHEYSYIIYNYNQYVKLDSLTYLIGTVKTKTNQSHLHRAHNITALFWWENKYVPFFLFLQFA